MTIGAESEYWFVVQDPDGLSNLLEIRPHDDPAKQQYRGVWNKLSQAVQKHHELGPKTPAPAWTTWKPWDWCDQRKGYESRQQFVAWAGNQLVGFLNVWPDFDAIHQASKRVLYIEHLAAAPGNLTTELWERRFRGVGAALFAYAVLVSHQRGFGGRLGLHVADEAALEFYRHLHSKKCGGALFYPEQSGVPGPTPHGEDERSKTYLETKEDAATGWLEGYRHG